MEKRIPDTTRKRVDSTGNCPSRRARKGRGKPIPRQGPHPSPHLTALSSPFASTRTQTANTQRVEVGPKTLVLNTNENVIGGVNTCIVIPPRHYCCIRNPVVWVGWWREVEGDHEGDKEGAALGKNKERAELVESSLAVFRALLEATDTRFARSTTQWAQLGQTHFDQAYAQAMQVVHSLHPNDADVLALYCDAVLNLSPWDYFLTKEEVG